MLAGAAAVLAMGANAQTLETVWDLNIGQDGVTIPGEPAASSRYAAAKDGKFILVDRPNLTVMSLDETGATTNIATLASAGENITTDDAGNIIISAAWAGAGAVKQWHVVPADGGEVVTFDIDWDALGATAARLDCIGRVVGNVLSDEGGYMWLPAKDYNAVVIAKIVNGAVDESYTQASAEIGFAADNVTICQPLYSTVAEIDALMDEEGDLSKSFYIRKRGNTYPHKWGEGETMESVNLSGTSEEGYTMTGSSYEGLEVFTLQGVTYYVVPMSADGASSGRGTVFGVYSEDGTLAAYYDDYLATVSSGAFATSHTQMSFIAEPIDDYSVYIYRWIPGKQAAKFKFSVADEAPADPLYIFGSFNEWNTVNSTEMTYANGVYTLEDIILDAGSNFGLATVQADNWDTINANRYGFATDNAYAILGGAANPIVKGSGAIQVALAGTYDITVDLNAMTITLTGDIAYPEKLYVLGNLSVGNWDTNAGIELTPTNGVYEGTITVTDASEGYGYFTFVSALGANWDAVNASVRFGATEKDEAIADGETKALKSVGGGGENSWKVAAGEWNVKVDLNAFTVTITKATGVEGVAVAAEEVPAVYYNLQGVQVNNPANGLYIVKRGNKVTKELIVK